GTNQILVIEKRAAERALKKTIGQYVLARQSKQRRMAVIVMAHGQPAGIPPRGIAVVAAAVDLHLMFEKPMIQVARHGRRGERDLRLRGESAFDRKRRVRQPRTLR